MNAEKVREALQRITLGKSRLFVPGNDGHLIKWRVEPVEIIGKLPGCFVSLFFFRPDTNTGDMGWGESRREFIAHDATPDSVIKTGFLLMKLVIEHELMESFLVDGVRIFDPHRSVHAHQQAAEYERLHAEMEAA